MIAAAVNNSFKESWRQNQATRDIIRFTTVSPLYGLAFFSEMGGLGHRRSSICSSTDAPPYAALNQQHSITAFLLRGSATSALIRPCYPRINTLAAASIGTSYWKEREEKRGGEQKICRKSLNALR